MGKDFYRSKAKKLTGVPYMKHILFDLMNLEVEMASRNKKNPAVQVSQYLFWQLNNIRTEVLSEY